MHSGVVNSLQKEFGISDLRVEFLQATIFPCLTSHLQVDELF